MILLVKEAVYDKYMEGVVAAETGNTIASTGAALAGSLMRQPRSRMPSLLGKDVEESGIKRPMSSISSLNKGTVNGNKDQSRTSSGIKRPLLVPIISLRTTGKRVQSIGTRKNW